MPEHARGARLEEHTPTVEAALRAHVERASASGLPLYRMMQYQLGWVDKDGLESHAPLPSRTMGALCMEAAHAAADPAFADRAAAAVELFVGSVAVHEEMQSGEAGPDTHPAVWWVWGPAQAINVGDGLHALARLAVMRLRDQGLPTETTLACMDALDDLALRYYEGQYIELTYQERVDITLAQYSTMVRSKRGALLGGACSLGATVAGAEHDVAKAFFDLGLTIGEAVQVQADLNGLWQRNETPEGRILNKSKLHPVVDVLECGTLAQKRAVGTIYFKRVMEGEDIQRLRDLLTESGARERSQARVAELTSLAKHAVAGLTMAPETAARWTSIVDELVAAA